MVKKNSKQRVAEELISYTVINDKGSLTKLLKTHNVKVSDNPSDKEVTTAVLVGNKNKAFRKDLTKLLGDKLPKAGERFSNIVGNAQDFGFTGVDDVTYMKWTGVDDFNDFTGWDDWKNQIGAQTFTQLQSVAQKTAAQNKATQPKGKTKAGSIIASLWSFTKENVLTKDNINQGIQSGLNKINSDTAAKQLAIDEKALALQQQQEDMRQQQSQASVGVSSNVWLYVGIGAVVVLIGVLAFRKK
jgi:hypothetical protein